MFERKTKLSGWWITTTHSRAEKFELIELLIFITSVALGNKGKRFYSDPPVHGEAGPSKLYCLLIPAPSSVISRRTRRSVARDDYGGNL